MPDGAYHLHRAADAVVNVEQFTCGGEAGVGAPELDDQAFGFATLQPQAAVGVVIAHADFVAHHVDNVGVVPDAFGSHFFGAHFQAVHAVTAKAVEPDHRAMIIA